MNRHVHVGVAAHDERRRRDLVETVERRDLDPQLGVLPRQAELGLPLALVVIGAVVGEVVELARARDRRLEAVRLRDDVVGEDAAVAPAADAEPIGIGDAHRDRRVDRRHHVVVVLVAPVGEDRAAEVAAVARRAARVGGDDGEALRGQHLPFEVEAGGVLADRAAVNAQDRRQCRGALGASGGRVRNASIIVPSALFALNRSTVPSVTFARNSSLTCVSCGGAAPTGAAPACRKQIHLGRLLRLRVEERDVAGLAEVERRDVALAVEHAHDRAAGDRHAREVTLPPSSSRNRTLAPSGENCGERTLRSRPAVRSFGAPPATGTSATLFVAYQMSFGSPPVQVRDRLAVRAERRR